MRFGRPLLVAWCIGSIAGGCTSDLQLALEGRECKNERCVTGYTCDIPNNVCIPLGTLPSAGAGGTRPINPTGGAGSGPAGRGGDGGAGGDAMPAGQGGLDGGGLGGGSPDDLDGGGPLQPLDGGDACVPVAVYRDRDNDGFGDVSDARIGCPGTGWVVDNSDCRDDRADVRPNQTGFFREGYVVSGGFSFDYDCSGVEEPSTNNDLDPVPTCTGLGLTCNDTNGYLAADDPPRSGNGVDARCGSVRRRDCSTTGVLSECVPEDTRLADDLAFVCH